MRRDDRAWSRRTSVQVLQAKWWCMMAIRQIRFPPESRVTNTPHRDRCVREATQDVLFLLQRRRWNLTSTNIEGIADSDSESLNVDVFENLPDWLKPLVQDHDEENPGYIPLNSEFFSAAEKEDDDNGAPICISTWESESVWVDRDEAEVWAMNHAYRFPHGWRVYGEWARGALAKMLRTQDGE